LFVLAIVDGRSSSGGIFSGVALNAATSPIMIAVWLFVRWGIIAPGGSAEFVSVGRRTFAMEAVGVGSCSSWIVFDKLPPGAGPLPLRSMLGNVKVELPDAPPAIA